MVVSLLLHLLAYAVMFIGGVLIMIHGWGLTPVSWGWIIFAPFVIAIIYGFLIWLAQNID
jgi:hypothetical protein